MKRAQWHNGIMSLLYVTPATCCSICRIRPKLYRGKAVPLSIKLDAESIADNVV